MNGCVLSERHGVITSRIMFLDFCSARVPLYMNAFGKVLACYLLKLLSRPFKLNFELFSLAC